MLVNIITGRLFKDIANPCIFFLVKRSKCSTGMPISQQYSSNVLKSIHLFPRARRVLLISSGVNPSIFNSVSKPFNTAFAATDESATAESNSEISIFLLALKFGFGMSNFASESEINE